MQLYNISYLKMYCHHSLKIHSDHIPIMFFKLMLAGIISTIYSLVMMVVLIGLIKEGVESQFCSVTTVFFCFVAGVFIVAALIHPQASFSIIERTAFDCKSLNNISRRVFLWVFFLGIHLFISWSAVLSCCTLHVDAFDSLLHRQYAQHQLGHERKQVCRFTRRSCKTKIKVRGTYLFYWRMVSVRA